MFQQTGENVLYLQKQNLGNNGTHNLSKIMKAGKEIEILNLGM